MVTPQELLARAEALVPRLLERAARTDTERRVPAETVQEMRDAELFGIMQPVEYGGFAMRQIDFFEIARTLARGCPSTGWIMRCSQVTRVIWQPFPNKRESTSGAGTEATF